jgi:hypothetical protein
MNATITASAPADMLGATTRTIRDLKTRGITVAARRDFVLVESVRAYCKHLRNLAICRGSEATISSATAERARLSGDAISREQRSACACSGPG